MGVAKSTSTTVLVNPKKAKAFGADRMTLHSVDNKAAISKCILTNAFVPLDIISVFCLSVPA